MFLRKAVTLIRNVIVGGSDKSYQTCKFECDSASDLPAQDQTTYMIDIGSEAHDIDQNATYMMKSNGTWTLQEAGTAAYTKAETDALLADKADKSTTYTKTQTDNLLAAKADASSVYTKTQTDNLLAAKADASSVYTKTQTDNLLAAKADASSVYTKTQTDSHIQTDVFGYSDSMPRVTANSDLNEYTLPGSYVCLSASNAGTLDNSPFGGTYNASAFKLEVRYIQSANNIQQTIYPLYSDGSFFIRRKMTGADGTWRQWVYFSGTPV